MSHLIEVEQSLLRAMDEIVAMEEAGETPSVELMTEFGDAVMLAAEKRDNVARALQFLDERADALRAREKVIAGQRRAMEAAAERLAGYVLAVLEGKSIVQANGNMDKLVIATSESVEVANPDALPDELCRIKTVREPDKAAIKKVLEAGGRIELAAGARIQSRTKLRVKPLAVKDRPGDTLLKGRLEQ